MGLRFLYALVAICAAMLALPAMAAADHNADLHSPNMRLDFNSAGTNSSAQSDIAMWGNIVVAGRYNGFRIFDMSRPPAERLRSSFLCRGPQNDVSLWEHEGQMLLFLSNDTPQINGDTICGTSGSSTDTSPCNTPSMCFEGIRIFDITNPTAPQLIRAVYTICGSHTHTLVPDLDDNRVLLYISSAGGAGGPCQAPHAKISIVQVPLDAPETASVHSTPPLSVPGFGSFQGCHDITVYLAIHKAAASCQTEGQIWDISDPAAPQTLTATHVDTAGVNYWHSASFTYDGRYVVWNDESFTGRCNATNDGRIRIYRISDNTMVSSFMIPRPQGSAYCSVHNGNIIPVAGRYLLVAGWYAGGTSVVDFTNPAAPVEVAHYDASVGGATDTWSSYWYNNAIYATDFAARGIDVFNWVTPRYPYGNTWGRLNAQTQEADFFPPPPMETLRPVSRLLEPPTAVPPTGGTGQAGPGGYTPARAVKRTRASARARGWLLRSRARASKRR